MRFSVRSQFSWSVRDCRKDGPVCDAQCLFVTVFGVTMGDMKPNIPWR